MQPLFDALPADRPIWDSSGDNRLICCGVKLETSDAKTYVFAPLTPARLVFLPGQYMNFTFDIGSESVERCYSIASAATNEARVAITVKRKPNGRISNWLFDQMRVGSTVRASAALGRFTPAGINANKVLLLSAGSGITPVMSMLRTFASLGVDRNIAFLHYARALDDVIFRDELEHLARQMPELQLNLVTTGPGASQSARPPLGRITPQTLLELTPDIAERAVFCCGPSGFMEVACESSLSQGVPANSYFEEHFVLPPDGSPDIVLAAKSTGASFSVRFNKLDRVVDCPATATLLKAAQLAKIPLPSSCQRGICGTCRTKMISGTVDMQHAGGIRPRDIEKGFILPCCSRPTSNVVLDR
jgi:ferredoxin-NADP reductase